MPWNCGHTSNDILLQTCVCGLKTGNNWIEHQALSTYICVALSPNKLFLVWFTMPATPRYTCSGARVASVRRHGSLARPYRQNRRWDHAKRRQSHVSTRRRRRRRVVTMISQLHCREMVNNAKRNTQLDATQQVKPRLTVVTRIDNGYLYCANKYASRRHARAPFGGKSDVALLLQNQTHHRVCILEELN